MWFNNAQGNMWGRPAAPQQMPQQHPMHAMAYHNAMAQQQHAAHHHAAQQQQQQQQQQAYYVQAQGQDLDAADEPLESAMDTSMTEPMSTQGDGFNAADFFNAAHCAFRGMLKDAGFVPPSTMTSTVNGSMMESTTEEPVMAQLPGNQYQQYQPPPRPPPQVNMKMEEGSTPGMDPGIKSALQDAVNSRAVSRLEAALKKARDAGYRHGPEVSNAREMLLHVELANVKERAGAMVEEAVRSDDNWKMQAAMTNLVASGGGQGGQLEHLKRQMQEHNKKKTAIHALRSAAAAQDTVRLKTAIEAALKNHIEEVYIREARDALRRIEAQGQMRQELQSAIGTKSLSTIRPTYERVEQQLSQSEAGKDVLAKARRTMSEIATEQLQGLLRKEDTQSLDALLKEAQTFFVDERTIADLQKQSNQLKEQRQQKTKLKEALSTGQKSNIESALKSAKAASLPREHLEAAEKELQRRSNMEKADASRGALERARKTQDPEELRIAIANAEAAGLGGIDLVAAKEVYRSLAAQSSSQRELSVAMQSGDVYKLNAAIATARSAQVDEGLLASASRRLKSLKEQASARRDLDAAVASGDPREIESALARAKEVGLPPNETNKAHNVLKSSVGLDVVEQLRVAMMGDDVDELRTAANAALHAGVPAADVDAAWARELQAAISSGDCAKLQASIKHAEDVGLPAAETEDAKAELDRLVRRRSAQQELTMARVSGNAEVLSAALETARACGVDSSLLEAAQNDLAALA